MLFIFNHCGPKYESMLSKNRQNEHLYSISISQRRQNRSICRKSVDEVVKLLMGMLVSFAKLDGKTGYAELIGELDRLLVYYRRTVAVRKGRRSAAKERAKSRKHRSNADIQGVREERDIQDKQGSREKHDAPNVPNMPNVSDAPPGKFTLLS